MIKTIKTAVQIRKEMSEYSLWQLCTDIKWDIPNYGNNLNYWDVVKHVRKYNLKYEVDRGD